MHFVFEGAHDFAAMNAFEILLQPAQRDAYNVAVMEPGSHARVRAEAQPDAMQAVDVLRP
jgi:uncharacterized secreted protein with C-terminal beta-propeller domain